MSNPPVIAGVVLAAGAGTRFGMPKVLAAEGEWLKAAVQALVGGGCAHVIVVLGAAVVDVPEPARAVVATDWSDGLSASLRTGIEAAAQTGADLVALHLVDTPDIGGDVVARVVAAAAETGLARAVYDGRPGHPVAIARRHWPELLRVVHGDEGAKLFLRGRTDVVAVECADLATGHDIDVNP
ncbi:nucleotidyltransferase family protein [Mycolicibacterium goodii]|uniref:NTP transferase domain-containing protein n=1 Tax=Mycolicibacterium goodii TaxID=134601 RepID=A0ABS6HPM0_MYCGD|nr:NTP transferase domain-containing protein [Mycolicibacterium goodii]MBU8818097.1 NTP transferase domain-containing protein [Mycolicibacterium goodii]MBU8823207.1 NTP transferase domain-containing protein [Mycolicibacterium goodii]MBU8828546.1 NTP transferase domain-containing protein [Mycolicibacterium goodii]MBU8837353.1 NTP transferase domain-containing protein [Mycolicibacterium goodii]PJK22704.1 molybdopterin-guanine dinucleotide biosynthesis protein MobA [Mycolicibacterium goodii]